MTPNSTTINFDPAIPTDWEKSTYYTRDAQGNVMAIYEYTIDDATQDNHYTLTERNIYGSSRLGNNNAPVEMIAITPPNTSQYSHYIGYRQYELSNHLGNVLAVLSDRKIARDTDQDNTVDYYEPDVLLTFDYSPFGAPLHARSFTKEVCDEVTSTQKIEDLNTDFNNGTSQQWAKLSSTTNLNASTGRLEVYKQGGGAGQLGVQQSIMATSGYVYDFTITIENAFTSNSTVVLEIIDPNNTVIYTQSVGNGNPNPIVTFTHQFTASATGTYLIKVYRTGNQSNGSFYIDDALITHEEEVTQTLCEDFAGYRYGFNGQEKDNEVKGAGNSYTAEFWQYDSRTGKRWNLDPVLKPWESPYAVIANNPIWFIDPIGRDSSLSGKDNLWRWDVEKGDTYSSISNRTGVSLENLRAWNKYEDTKIPIGAQLNISDPSTPKSDKPATVELSGGASIQISYTAPEWVSDMNPSVGMVYGPLVDMSYTDPGGGSIDWVQTFNTNYMISDLEGNLCLNCPLSDAWTVDPPRPGNQSHLFEEGNVYYDYPRRPPHSSGNSVFWVGEASAVQWTGNNYKRLATFKYGFVVIGSNNARQVVFTITDKVSEFHQQTIINLPTK